MIIKKGEGVGSPVLGGFLGTRAESNFQPMGVSSNRGGVLAGSIIRGGFENRGGLATKPIPNGGHEV